MGSTYGLVANRCFLEYSEVIPLLEGVASEYVRSGAVEMKNVSEPDASPWVEQSSKIMASERAPLMAYAPT